VRSAASGIAAPAPGAIALYLQTYYAAASAAAPLLITIARRHKRGELLTRHIIGYFIMALCAAGGGEEHARIAQWRYLLRISLTAATHDGSGIA